jgi:hypothetical protein
MDSKQTILDLFEKNKRGYLNVVDINLLNKAMAKFGKSEAKLSCSTCVQRLKKNMENLVKQWEQ